VVPPRVKGLGGSFWEHWFGAKISWEFPGSPKNLFLGGFKIKGGGRKNGTFKISLGRNPQISFLKGFKGLLGGFPPPFSPLGKKVFSPPFPQMGILKAFWGGKLFPGKFWVPRRAWFWGPKLGGNLAPMVKFPPWGVKKMAPKILGFQREGVEFLGGDNLENWEFLSKNPLNFSFQKNFF